MKTLAVLAALLFLSVTAFAVEPAPASAADNQTDDEISVVYRVLMKPGAYEEKKAKIGVFKDRYKEERVLDIIVNLLEYSYDNQTFKENDQSMYYDDVIAEELVKILGKNGSPKAFPALLHVALYNRLHRESTVREAWKAMMMIRW